MQCIGFGASGLPGMSELGYWVTQPASIGSCIPWVLVGGSKTRMSTGSIQPEPCGLSPRLAGSAWLLGCVHHPGGYPYLIYVPLRTLKLSFQSKKNSTGVA